MFETESLNWLVVGGVIVWVIVCLGLTLGLIAILWREYMDLNQRVSAIGDALAQQTTNLDALAKQLSKQGATLEELIMALERGLVIPSNPARTMAQPAKREIK